MDPNVLQTIDELPGSNRSHYWALQIFGWSALAVISVFSLALWYNPGEFRPAVHAILQSPLGLIISHPLRSLTLSVWNASPVLRISINAIGVLLAAAAWTVARILSFDWITGEEVQFGDYGGWIFASITVFGAWSFCYHGFRYYRLATDQKALTLAAQKLALEQRERAREAEFKALLAQWEFTQAKIRMLKYQLNPHFLFNALNSVTYLVRKDHKDQATAMLGKIGAFLRVTLDDDDSLDHSLGEEMEIVHLYLDIERERFGDRLETLFNISPEAAQISVPAFLLQPLVENALKHAVGASLDQVTIKIDAKVQNDRLHIQLTDNGPGFEAAPPDPESSHGIGLRNVRARLSSMFGENFDLNFADAEPGGAVINVAVPCHGAQDPEPPIAPTERAQEPSLSN